MATDVLNGVFIPMLNYSSLFGELVRCTAVAAQFRRKTKQYPGLVAWTVEWNLLVRACKYSLTIAQQPPWLKWTCYYRI